MNPYITYEIAGLCGISVLDEPKVFPVSNQGNIESIEILVDNSVIKGIRVYFSSDTVIDEFLENSTNQIISLYLANIIGTLDAVIKELSIKPDKIFNPNLPPENEPLKIGNIKLMLMTNRLPATVNYAIERYDQLFTEIPTDEFKKDKLLLFTNIMGISNIVVRYLMQYEYLMSLVAPNRTQKEVTKFIRDEFNLSRAFNTIGFQPTRRSNKTNDEDDITYYRNILAHNDSSALPDNFEQIINTMNRAIKEVIFFKLNQLP